ncbi:MAG: hypothetical protein H6714_00575 [Myxococcales bacterium]|nr:hypothetical protein [Myxococcales bacterium]
MGKSWLSVVLLLVAACHSTGAEDSQPTKAPLAQKQAPEPVTATMLTFLDTKGARWAGVHFKIQKGWHIYGKVSGDSGLPTRVSWQLPTGASASAVHYPPAERFTDTGDIVTYGYTTETLLLSEITLGKSTLEPVQIAAKVKWLACQASQCVPGEANLSQPLLRQPAPDGQLTALFERFKPGPAIESPEH